MRARALPVCDIDQTKNWVREVSFKITAIFQFYQHVLQMNVFETGISDPVFYGDLVYQFKIIVGKPNLVVNNKDTKLDVIWIKPNRGF